MSDILLHELVDRMGRDLIDITDPYAESPHPGLMARSNKDLESRLGLMARANKDLEAEQLDYDTLLNAGNPNPSLRDSEYLQHSPLFGHQYVDGGSAEVGLHHFNTQPKTDATLPAYCNPPNPCPVGYTEEQGCTEVFENTAAFSRDYQASQECMCDGEHMFDCSGPKDGSSIGRQINSEYEGFLARQFQASVNGKGYKTKKLGHASHVSSLRKLIRQESSDSFQFFVFHRIHF